MSIQREVDRLIDERPGRALLDFRYDDAAFRVHERIHRSGGTSASYLLDAGSERVVVNTGMGWEAPHHKQLFDAVCARPTAAIVTTQAHVDHVGGVAHFRDPGTRYVAQANNAACQADDARLAKLRARTALLWFPDLPERIGGLLARFPDARQDTPTPDLGFDDALTLPVGDLTLELLATPGGETIDSCVVWLPALRVVLVGNLFGPLFPHFPNFNTLRGDRYRLPLPYLESLRRVRALAPEVLITGRHLPIVGAALIDAALGRLHDAVEHVHRETLAGMNAGKDVFELMRTVELPPALRVGQDYGKVSWAVRTIFESYTGWFRRRSTADLYASPPEAAAAELAALAGASALLERARERLADGDAPTAIRMAEALLAHEPGHRGAARLMADAHEALLDAGGDRSFWEHGWLRHQRARWRGDPA
jgi:alkyl sulfatase BDS1-like metallo-beta-lactamase superfamily hydrolase